MASDTMVIAVTLDDRSDAGLRVYSDDLPGLILSGPDKTIVCDAIVPAIRDLLERRGLHVSDVRLSKSPAEVVKMPAPRALDVHVRQFVVEYKAAA